MANFTTRLGLTKPTGAEARAVTPLNTNADLIDKFLPCILVNDGVTPPTGDLYDGALVKERNSGIIWEARKNGGGTYDKVYVRYPFSLQVGKGGQSIANATVTEVTFDTSTVNFTKNSSAANINGSNRFVVPIKGIYLLHLHASWAANATGLRNLHHNFNGTANAGDLEEVTQTATAAPSNTKQLTVLNKLMNANDTYTPSVYQTSGGALNVTCFLQVHMIEPVQ